MSLVGVTCNRAWSRPAGGGCGDGGVTMDGAVVLCGHTCDCAWRRPAGGGWGEGGGGVAMDGAVVLALHSDTLFMEPLIAQARCSCCVLNHTNTKHGMLRTRLADGDVDGPMRLLAATVCNFMSALARRQSLLAARVRAACQWRMCCGHPACARLLNQVVSTSLLRTAEAARTRSAFINRATTASRHARSHLWRRRAHCRHNGVLFWDACVCRAAARLARRTW